MEYHKLYQDKFGKVRCFPGKRSKGLTNQELVLLLVAMQLDRTVDVVNTLSTTVNLSVILLGDKTCKTSLEDSLGKNSMSYQNLVRKIGSTIKQGFDYWKRLSMGVIKSELWLQERSFWEGIMESERKPSSLFRCKSCGMLDDKNAHCFVCSICCRDICIECIVVTQCCEMVVCENRMEKHEENGCCLCLGYISDCTVVNRPMYNEDLSLPFFLGKRDSADQDTSSDESSENEDSSDEHDAYYNDLPRVKKPKYKHFITDYFSKIE
jgi:hypothetical protein